MAVLAVAIAMVSLAACSSEDDGPKKVTPASGQESTVSAAANTSAGEVRFKAVAPWSAWTDSNPSRSPGDIDWITLNDTRGEAGDITLNFTLKRNTTGKDRTGYIVVVCEDSQLTFTITQSAEDDPNEPDSPDEPGVLDSGTIEIVATSYENNAGKYELDGETYYELSYTGGRMMQFVSKYRDELDSWGGPNGSGPETPDAYCDNVETTVFEYGADRVRAVITAVATYKPSGETETETSEHEISVADGRATAGWYWYKDEDLVRTDFDFTYDAEGHLATSRNNDASDVWDTHSFTWQSGNLVKISCTTYDPTAISYGDASLENQYPNFDLNWALPNEIECYDFAAGDITRIWGVAGLLGAPSKLLATEMRCEGTKSGDSKIITFEYSKHTNDETVVRVSYFQSSELRRYTDWKISYYGHIF